MLRKTHVVGHPGIYGLSHLLASYWWPDKQKDIEKVVKGCQACPPGKTYSNRQYGLPLPLVKQHPPLKSWGIDFTELPVSKEGNDF